MKIEYIDNLAEVLYGLAVTCSKIGMSENQFLEIVELLNNIHK